LVVVVVASVVVGTVDVVVVAGVVGAVEVDWLGADVVLGSAARLEQAPNTVSVTTRRARRIARP
jgi:hypothetical protein